MTSARLAGLAALIAGCPLVQRKISAFARGGVVEEGHADPPEAGREHRQRDGEAVIAAHRGTSATAVCAARHAVRSRPARTGVPYARPLRSGRSADGAPRTTGDPGAARSTAPVPGQRRRRFTEWA
ncbi:hypothetical protein [Nocardia sp. No.11]|uniref:hypothetical protein n=1 Tax=Nocardia sp. No.11 TaxID=3128861 RepID=UPI00319DF49C